MPTRPRTLLATTSVAVLSLAVLLPTSASGQGVWSQQGADIPGAAVGDNFGIALDVSSDGTTLAIGADSNDDGGTDAGQVRIVGITGGAWTQSGLTLEGGGASHYFGSAVSLSGDGTRVAIGAPFGGVSSAGLVQVWELASGTWAQMGADIAGEGAGDRAGSSVAISGDGTTVVIGSPFNDDAGTDRGEVRVFSWNTATTTWDRTGSVDLAGEANQDRLGYSVAISEDGSVIAAGARDNDGSGTAAGHVRVFGFTTATSQWDQRASDIEGEAAGDRFGTSVSLDSTGTVVAIGAPENSVGSTAVDAGHVRVLSWNAGTTTWVQQGADLEGAAGDLLGSSLSLSAAGTRLLVGAPGGAVPGVDAGYARLYGQSSGAWGPLGTDLTGEAGDTAGSAVALSADGTTAALGLPSHDGVATNAGLAQVFRYTVTVVESEGESVENPGVPGIYLHVAGPVGRSVQGSPVYYGSDRVAYTSSYLLSIISSSGDTLRVMAEGSVNATGNLEAMVALPALQPGNYDVVFTGRHHGGAGLSLSARIVVGTDGAIRAMEDNVALMRG